MHDVCGIEELDVTSLPLMGIVNVSDLAEVTSWEFGSLPLMGIVNYLGAGWHDWPGSGVTSLPLMGIVNVEAPEPQAQFEHSLPLMGIVNWGSAASGMSMTGRISLPLMGIVNAGGLNPSMAIPSAHYPSWGS